MKVFTLFIAVLISSTLFVKADGNEQNIEELIMRHKSRIEKAGSGDWKTYADCANALVVQRIASDEVLDWINQSITINETIFNRTVKGDYFVLKGEIEKAQLEYIKAIQLAREENKHDEISGIQWKILISKGVENYNNFHADKLQQ